MRCREEAAEEGELQDEKKNLKYINNTN